MHGYHQDLRGHGARQSLCGIFGIWRHHPSSDFLQVLLLSNLDDGKSGRWEGAQSKGVGHECDLDRKMFLYSDLLKFCLKQNQDITKLFPDNVLFLDENN